MKREASLDVTLSHCRYYRYGNRQGRRNYFEAGGGGEQACPGVQDNPYPKLKTPRVCSLFLGGIGQVHVQKLTKIKIIAFYIDSPYQRFVGGAPQLPSWEGVSCPDSPPPRFPRRWK